SGRARARSTAPTNEPPGYGAFAVPSVRHDTAAERDVERDQIRGLGAPDLEQRLLGVEQVALGIEHLEVADDAGLVTGACELRELPLRLRRALLRVDRLGQITPSGKRVRDFPERRLDRELVIRDRLVLARLGDRDVRPAAPEIENRHPQCRTEAPRVA